MPSQRKRKGPYLAKATVASPAGARLAVRLITAALRRNCGRRVIVFVRDEHEYLAHRQKLVELRAALRKARRKLRIDVAEFRRALACRAGDDVALKK